MGKHPLPSRAEERAAVFAGLGPVAQAAWDDAREGQDEGRRQEAAQQEYGTEVAFCCEDLALKAYGLSAEEAVRLGREEEAEARRKRAGPELEEEPDPW